MSFALPKNLPDALERRGKLVVRYRGIQAELAGLSHPQTKAEHRAINKKKKELVQIMTPVLNELQWLKKWIKEENISQSNTLRTPHKALRESAALLHQARSLFSRIAQGVGVTKDEALEISDKLTTFLLSDTVVEHFQVER